MEIGFLEVLLGLALAGGFGFLLAWLLRGQALDRITTYTRSLEQLLAGTMRERDAAFDRERMRLGEGQAKYQQQAQRLAELEKELEHRELQAVTFREEAIQLARTREELGQRLARREQTVHELEAALAARNRELQDGGYRHPGSRGTGPERELAALVAAHENDLAQLEARSLDAARIREAELEEARQQLRALQAASGEIGDRDVQLAAARERVAELESVLQRTAVQVEALERELRDEEAARAKLQKRLTDLEPMTTRLRQLEQRLAQLEPGSATPVDSGSEGRSPDPPAAGLQSAVAGNGRRENEPAARGPRPRSRRSRGTAADDLKLVAGIDASVEQALHLLGVTTFRQLARWKDKDIERMARKLYQPADRIRQEGWVESARQEHTRKYGRAP